MKKRLMEILRKPVFPHALADTTEAVADYLLDNGVVVQEWVPLVRKLPKDGESVLLPVEYDDEEPPCLVVVRWSSGVVDKLSGVVTHWMKLPEPPKKSKKNQQKI